jgi:hypothetical protein
MFQINDITDQVLDNCNIADARHAGLYSICGLALRLRDLYKWENRLDPWIENDPSEVLKWIGDKEETWEKLVEKDFGDITLLGNQFDPFDVKGINAILEPHGYIYGGGYARGLKPSFFLAAIEDKKEKNGITIFVRCLRTNIFMFEKNPPDFISGIKYSILKIQDDMLLDSVWKIMG